MSNSKNAQTYHTSQDPAPQQAILAPRQPQRPSPSGSGRPRHLTDFR